MQHTILPASLPNPAEAAPHPLVTPRGFVPPRTVASRELLGDATELLIEHHGAMYRLRLTSLGKLILTK